MLFSYLPVTGPAETAIVLVNTGNQSTSAVLNFYTADGRLLLRDGDSVQILEPGVPLAMLVEQHWPEISEDVCLVVESANQPLTGSTFVFDSAYLEPALLAAFALPENY